MGLTLGQLAARYAPTDTTNNTEKTASPGGQTKTASEEGTPMSNPSTSLTDIYLRLSSMDKTASAAAGEPNTPPEEEVDLAKVAAELAEIEAQAELEKGASGEGEGTGEGAGEGDPDEASIMKVAAEYDSAGRIMARGFFDEFFKLAAAGHTQATPNQMTESPSHASTPALGKRGLPTTQTNFAGSAEHTEGMNTKGGKEVYKTSLQSKKKVNAGVTGDNPEAAAVGLGGGSPSGFATIKDVMG